MEDFRKRAAKMVTLALGKQAGGGDANGVPDEGFLSNWPTIAAFMTWQGQDSKHPRQTASLTVFWEQGTFKAVLKDRATGKSLWATSETFAALLDTLEQRLNADVVEWREGGPVPPARRGR